MGSTWTDHYMTVQLVFVGFSPQLLGGSNPQVLGQIAIGSTVRPIISFYSQRLSGPAPADCVGPQPTVLLTTADSENQSTVSSTAHKRSDCVTLYRNSLCSLCSLQFFAPFDFFDPFDFFAPFQP